MLTVTGGGLFLQPFIRGHAFDLAGRDDRGATAVGISAGLGAVVRPLEFHAPGWIELPQQMLDERACGIDTAIAGMQPDTVFALLKRTLGFGFEEPDFQDVNEGRREVRWQFRWILAKPHVGGF